MACASSSEEEKKGRVLCADGLFRWVRPASSPPPLYCAAICPEISGFKGRTSHRSSDSVPSWIRRVQFVSKPCWLLLRQQTHHPGEKSLNRDFGQVAGQPKG